MNRLLRLLFSLALIFAGLSLVTPTADAAIYDNGGPDFLASIGSDFTFPQQVGDDFVLNAGANVIADIHWWGDYNTVPLSDNFTIRIFNILSGIPDTSPFYTNNVGSVTRVDTGDQLLSPPNFAPLEVFEYSVDVSPISLSAGTPYLLSIVNNTGTWFWATSHQSGDTVFRSNDGNLWGNFQGSFEQAFNLTGPSSVPEPSTLLLLGAGLAGVGIMRRKLRR